MGGGKENVLGGKTWWWKRAMLPDGRTNRTIQQDQRTGEIQGHGNKAETLSWGHIKS